MNKLDGYKQYIVMILAILLAVGLFSGTISVQDATTAVTVSGDLQDEIAQVSDKEATTSERMTALVLLVYALFKGTERSATKKLEKSIQELKTQ